MINQDNNLILDGVRTMPTQNQDYSNDLGFAGNQNSQILGTVGNSARTLNYQSKQNEFVSFLWWGFILNWNYAKNSLYTCRLSAVLKSLAKDLMKEW